MTYHDGFWMWDSYSHERSQNQALDELSRQNSRQSAKLHRTQRETKDQITKGISSVNSRMDTILSWVDLRFQLLEFDEYQARREVRRCFRGLASAAPTALPSVVDVPGYWLPPTALPLARLVLNMRALPGQPVDDNADIHKSLEHARESDPVRSDLFVLAAAQSFDLPQLAEPAVMRLLDGPVDFGAGDGEVAGGWRMLWEQAAQGDFGTRVAERLERRLADLFDPRGLDEAALTHWNRAILAPAESFGVGTLTTAKAFDRLTSLLSGMTTDTTQPGGQHYLQAWHATLEGLVNEPSRAEMPVVTAMEELRDAPETIKSRQQWSQGDGTIADRVRLDLLDDNTPVARRGLALRLSRDLLRQRVDVLFETETQKKPAGSVVKYLGATVRVYGNGPVPAHLAKARERIDKDIAPAAPTMPTTVATVLLALAAAGLAVGQQWALAVAFALAIAVPVTIRLNKQRLVTESVKTAQTRSARLDKELETAREKERKLEAKHAEDLETLTTARSALLDVLTTAAGNGTSIRASAFADSPD